MNKEESKALYTSSPQPRPDGSLLIVFAIVIAFVFEPSSSPYAIANHYAVFVGISILLSSLLELKTMGLGRVIRVDWVCIFVFYTLSYLEFIFDQPDLNTVSTLERTRNACNLFNLGFLTIVISRHFWPARRVRVDRGKDTQVSYRVLLMAFWAAFIIGYFHILISVRFDLFKAIDHMMGPRFSQPWGRGRLGDWKALLVELGLLIYLIPPIFGTLLALRKRIPKGQLFAALPVFLLTIFYGFSSGTRNVFGTYMITFLVAYLINQSQIRWVRIGLVSGVVAALTAWGSFHMLEFRNIGLARYIDRGAYQQDQTRDTLFVDFNLHYLGVLAEAFPENYDYLGAEVPLWAAVKPIPRALWSGKPEGLSVSIEQATNVEQMSVATTWVGESYMAYGAFGVILTGCLIGLLCGYWNQRGSQYEAPIDKIIFATGFFAAALTMRSSFWFTTAMLPTIAMIVGNRIYNDFLAPKRVKKNKSFRQEGTGL